MFWKPLFARRTGRAPRQAIRSRRASRPLFLEPLEDRAVPNASFHGHNDFGSHGQVTTSFTGNLSEGVRTVLVQPDGKIVAVGTSSNGFALARYTVAGALDTTFGSGGTVTTHFPQSDAFVGGAALEPDGSIVVTGLVENPIFFTGIQSLVARYTAAGKLDTSFGLGGHINVLAGTDSFPTIAVQSDGAIVVASSVTDYSGPTTEFVVERYGSGGQPDTGFGSGGQVTATVGPYAGVAGISFQSGGIIVGGTVADYSVPATDFVAARFTAGGVLDGSFGSGGLAKTPTIGQFGSATGVAVGPNGAVVVAGRSVNFNPQFTQSLVVARFTAGGILDSGFGSGGLANGGPIASGGVAVQPDGKVVVTGSAGGSMAAVRFTALGALDAGFGSGGTVTTPIGSSASARAVALQSDGKIVAAGGAFIPATGNDFALARYTTTEKLDAGFGGGGTLTTNFVGPVSGQATSVVPDGGGNFLVGGSTASSGGSLTVARYLPNGQLDNGFGNAGTVQVTFNSYLFSTFGGNVAVQQDSKILLVGTSIEPGTTNYDFAIARLLPNGNLDPKFGSGGKVTTFSGAKYTDMASSGGVVIQPDGKIVVAGYLEYYGTFPYVDKGVVIRYNTDGTLDTTFGNGGREEFTYPTGFTYFSRVSALALAPNGKLVIGGFATDFTTFNSYHFLEQLLPNGMPDATFQGSGQLITSIPVFDPFGSRALAVRPDGRILIGDTTVSTADGINFQTGFLLAQFTARGDVDTTFGSGGQVSFTYPGTFNIDTFTGSYVDLTSISLLANGQVVAAGIVNTFTPTTSTSAFIVTRFLANGNGDTSFGSGGWATASFTGFDTTTALLVQKDGKIVVVGFTFDPVAGPFAVSHWARRFAVSPRMTANRPAPNLPSLKQQTALTPSPSSTISPWPNSTRTVV